jgi:hypothetical protein
MADCERHGKQGEPEGQSDPDKANAKLRECSRDHCATATAEDKPESTKKFCCCAFRDGHRSLPRFRYFDNSTRTFGQRNYSIRSSPNPNTMALTVEKYMSLKTK